MSDPAVLIKARLRTDLLTAMRVRAGVEVAVLRALVATFDNAEAVELGEQHQRYVELKFGDRSAEVPRRRLTEADVESLLAREVSERRDAAVHLREMGQAERAARLAAEAEIVARYQTAGGQA